MINVKYLDELYDELLNIMQNSHTYKQEVLDKMLGEQRNSKKVKAILDHWDEFDNAPSDDPSIDHKYNRDYLWDKIRNDIPDEPLEKLQERGERGRHLAESFVEGLKNPTGIANPADYIGKVTVEKDADNDTTESYW